MNTFTGYMAPTDAQLDLIRKLCEERGFPMAVAYSKTDATAVIEALLTRSYHPPEWRDDAPF